MVVFNKPCRVITDDLFQMRQREKYLNNQYHTVGLNYAEEKSKLEDLEKTNKDNVDKVARLTTELGEVNEKLDDLKESFESKDSGLNDTSPLVKIKSALQQIKEEIHALDMRIGVVSNSLLLSRVTDHQTSRAIAAHKARQRHKKNKVSDDNSLLSDD